MPLIKSGSKSALNKNMSVLHGEVGESPHVQSHAQATAIALDIARKHGAKIPKPKEKRRRFGSLG